MCIFVFLLLRLCGLLNSVLSPFIFSNPVRSFIPLKNIFVTLTLYVYLCVCAHVHVEVRG